MARILILEDNLLISQVIRQMVTNAGHEVVAVCDRGQDAVEKIISEVPDLLLLDVAVPGDLDGPGVLRKVTELGFKGRTIFLSAFPEERVRDLLKDLVYYAYLIKPADQNTLSNTISAAVNE